jgi:hypothetical protein
VKKIKMQASIWKSTSEPDELTAAMTSSPTAEFIAHLCHRAPGGIVIIDTCPVVHHQQGAWVSALHGDQVRFRVVALRDVLAPLLAPRGATAPIPTAGSRPPGARPWRRVWAQIGHRVVSYATAHPREPAD